MTDLVRNPFNSPFFQQLAVDDPVAYLYFQSLFDGIDANEALKIIIVPATSGAEYVVDSFKLGRGNAVFYLYYARQGANYRAGMVMQGWDSAGGLPAAGHAESNIQDIGDTSDLAFSFDYDATSGTIRWKSSSTNAWRVKALRVLI